MKYVLDASVALKTLEGAGFCAGSCPLRRFQEPGRAADCPRYSPRRNGPRSDASGEEGDHPKGEAKVLFDQFITPCPPLFPYGDLFDRAMEISSIFRAGLYDCLYAALAEQEQCDLVTADEKLINSLPGFPIVSLNSL